MDNLYQTYGKPLCADYKKNMVGQKPGITGIDRPMRKFWYAAETTRYAKGTHFIFVEVVENNNQLSCSGFAIVNFPLGVPSDMK